MRLEVRVFGGRRNKHLAAKIEELIKLSPEVMEAIERQVELRGVVPLSFRAGPKREHKT